MLREVKAICTERQNVVLINVHAGVGGYEKREELQGKCLSAFESGARLLKSKFKWISLDIALIEALFPKGNWKLHVYIRPPPLQSNRVSIGKIY